MTHSILTTSLVLRKHRYVSKKKYNRGDTLFFQEIHNYKCTGKCFSFTIDKCRVLNLGYEYSLI